MADYGDPDQWELINHDGFVYKRRKRPRLDPAVADQRLDPTVERRRRRERKKKALVKLRGMYLKEISRWEHLSNTFKEMEQSALTHPLKRQELDNTASFREAPSSEQQLPSDSTWRRVVDDLLCQVEAEEAIIQEISNLCDVAEALCKSLEDRLNQHLADLAIWESSPRQLMAALCEQ